MASPPSINHLYRARSTALSFPDGPVEGAGAYSQATRGLFYQADELNIAYCTACNSLHETMGMNIRLHRVDSKPHSEPLARSDPEKLDATLEVSFVIACFCPSLKFLLRCEVLIPEEP